MFRKSKPTSVTRGSIEPVVYQHGLKVLGKLYSNSSDPFFSIILVHGPQGSILKSWTAENDCCWPEDLLPADITYPGLNGRNGRVLSWGYDAKLVSVGFSRSPSTATIHAHAKNLLADVNQSRDELPSGYHKIIFIGHSTGGIIIQAALCESMMGTDDLYKNVAGILFLGTPHRGFQHQGLKFASAFGSVVSSIGFGSKSPILKQLKPNSEVLQNINNQFRRVLKLAPIRICSAFETRETSNIGLIVDESTATFGLAEEISLPLDADHAHLSKFLGGGDINYKRVLNVLRQWVNEITKEGLYIKEGPHRETSVAEPALMIDAVETDRGTGTTTPQTPENHASNGPSVVQSWDATTDNPLIWEPRAENAPAMSPSERLNVTNVPSIRPSSLPRSLRSTSTPTKHDMNTISTLASSVYPDSNLNTHNRSVAVGTSIIKSVEAAASTTTDATTPAASIITGLGVGIAGTALLVQTVTSRQALHTTRKAATASESSANTAKDSLALNQATFEYNKSKDLAAKGSKPKPPTNDKASPLSAVQVLELDDEMFPSVPTLSPTCAGPSKRKDDRDSDRDSDGGSEGGSDGDSDSDYHNPITDLENLPNINQHQLVNRDRRGKGKEGETRVQELSFTQQTLFDHGFKLFKPNFSSPVSCMPKSNKCISIGGSDLRKLQTSIVLPDDSSTVSVKEVGTATLLATEGNEIQNNGREIIDDTPKTGPEEDLAETITYNLLTETSAKKDILQKVASDVTKEYLNSSLHPAVANVQFNTATLDTIDKEPPFVEQETSIAIESAIEQSTDGRSSELALSSPSLVDDRVDQECVSLAKSTLEATENNEMGLLASRLTESLKAIELDVLSQPSNQMV